MRRCNKGLSSRSQQIVKNKIFGNVLINRKKSIIQSFTFSYVHEAYQYLVSKKKKMSGRSMQENWNLSRRKSMGVALLSLASAKEEAEAEVSTLFMIVNSLIFFIE